MVAHDHGNSDAVWITEVWESGDAWHASLELPWVKIAVEQSMALTAAFDTPATTRPVVVLP